MPTGEQFGTNVPQTFLASPVAAGATSIPVLSSASWPAAPFTAAFGIGTSLQEAIHVTNVSGTTWTVTRGYDGTVAQNQPLNQTVTHVDIGLHFREFRAHIDTGTSPDSQSEDIHGIGSGNSVVGTGTLQTLTGKTLTSPVINTPSINSGTYSGPQNMGTGVWSGNGSIQNNGTTDWFNAKAEGAVGNGVALDAAAINAAIALLPANGGVLYLPAGIYELEASIILRTGVRLVGAGMNATTLRPQASSNFDVISTAIPGSAGTPGFTPSFMGVEQMTIDGSSMTGTTNGQGNGIHFYGARYSYIRDVNITGVPNWGILLDGDITNFSYSMKIYGCRIINGSAGIMTVFSEEEFITNNNILQANATTAAQQPAFAPQSNVGYLIRCVAGYSQILGNVIGSSGTYTTAAIQSENAGPTRIIGNRFDQARFQAIRTVGPNNLIMGNQIGNPSSVGTVEGIRLGSTGNIVEGNIFDTTNGAAHYTYCVLEPAAEGSNVIAGNKFVAGTSGTVSLNAASVGNQVYGNVGYNPVGSVSPPTFPGTTVPVTNNTGGNVTAYVVGSTITAVTVAGVATGQTGTSTGITVRIPSGSTVAFTYASGTPTWTWFLD